MRKIEHRTWICLLIAGLLAAGLLVFIVLFFKDGGQWASASFNRHLYSSSGSLLSGRLLDREGKLHLDRCGLAAFAHGEYFKLGEKLGSFGFSVRKKKKPRRPPKK